MYNLIEYIDNYAETSGSLWKYCKVIAAVDNNNGIVSFTENMCGYFGIGFIDFMLKGKNLTDFTNLFSSNNLKKNDDIILNYFLTNP